MALPEVGVKAVVKDSRKFMGTLGKMGGAVSGFGKTALMMGGKGVAAIGIAVAAVGTGMIKLAADAAALEGIGNAFDGLTADMEGGSAQMLRALQEGSKGMITNTDLMTGFNKAAQLVSKDFAQTLPDAMGYLGKVSAATGQDMDFMLDSLTTGIGRLSPMILDNLGIQVSLSEANEAYAASIGKTVKELTKEEQQTALMNQVMEKLAKNTEDMPDITDNAATKMAQFKVSMKNLKDTLGKALLPLFKKLVDFLTKIGTGLSDLFAIFQERGFDDFFTTFEDGSNAIGGFLEKLGLSEGVAYAVGDAINQLVGFFRNLYDGISTLVSQFTSWGFDEFFSTFEDGSNAIGGFLNKLGLTETAAYAVGDVINKIVTWIKNDLVPAIQDFIPKAMKAAADVWKAVLKPALEALWKFIQDPLIPMIKQLIAWLQENIPVAMAAVKKFWESTLRPALAALKAFIEDPVIPIIKQVWAWLKEKIPQAFQVLKDAWQNILKPALNALWGFIQDTIIPIIEEAWEWLKEKIPQAFQVVKDAWQNILKPALNALWAFIRDNVIPIIEAAVSWIEVNAPRAFRAMESAWNNVLKPALQGIYDIFIKIRDAIQWAIDKVVSLIDWLGKIKIPEINLPDLPDLGGFIEDLSVGGGNTVAAPALSGASARGGGVTIQMTNHISSDMDMAVFESRVLQVVTDAVGA